MQVPVDDMADMGRPAEAAERARLAGPGGAVDLERHSRQARRADSRRTGPRCCSSTAGGWPSGSPARSTSVAGEGLVRAHHGSLARAQRTEIEDLLKAGQLRGLVATSSLELGIDMGAIDLVVQIEAPPSVASGLQRIGRAGHRIDEVSEGIIFPKFRGDLVACAAVTAAMRRGQVEPSRYPRNPLDVLAQQLVAMAAMDRWAVDDLFAGRCAAPRRSPS